MSPRSLSRAGRWLLLGSLLLLLSACSDAEHTGPGGVQEGEERPPAVHAVGEDTGRVIQPLPDPEPPRTLLVDEQHDITGDGAPERIRLYTAAERDRAGRMQWDDGQRWALHVLAGGATYPLFDDYVQIGRLRFWIVETEPGAPGSTRILLLRETGAGVELRSYRYQPGRGFLATVEHTTSGNVVFTSPEIR